MTTGQSTITPPLASDARAGPAAASPVIDTPEMRDALDCPLCGYSLRGLSATSEEPRCPECGYPFKWCELLSARQRLHPFLFEHHSSAGSFVRTLRAAARPRRFWSSLNAGHRLHVHWLLVYSLLMGILIALTAFAGHLAAEVLKHHDRTLATGQQIPAGWVILPGAPPRQPQPFFLIREAWRTTAEAGEFQSYLLVACLGWPWVTIGTLLIFQTSMRRAHIRSAHVLRCVVYSYGPFIWIGILLAVAAALRAFGVLPRDLFSFSSPLPHAEAWQTIGLVALVTTVATYRLGVAYAQYLRFEHAWSTVLASQLIFLLVAITALAVSYPMFYQLLV